MALTPFQLKSLRYDLVELAHVKYDDVVDELLDHYASLTEQKMETGMSFDEASKWAWAELDLETGLKTIQTTYEKSILQKLRKQHLAIIKSYLFMYIPAHSAAMTTFCIVFALFVASLVQLTREQFHYKLT